MYSNAPRQLIYFDARTKEWIDLNNMPTERAFAACGVVSVDGKPKEVVVAGGEASGSYLKDVEILTVSTLQWRTAKQSLPVSQSRATSVQYGDTFLVVGGQISASAELDTVYMYNPATEGWTLMPNRMRKSKHGVAAMIMKPGDFQPC